MHLCFVHCVLVTEEPCEVTLCDFKWIFCEYWLLPITIKMIYFNVKLDVIINLISQSAFSTFVIAIIFLNHSCLCFSGKFLRSCSLFLCFEKLPAF